MTDLEELQRRVEQYFQCGQRNEPQGRIILDMMRALRALSQEHELLRVRNAILQGDNARLRAEIELVSK